MITLNLNKNEADVLVRLLDIATKASGLQAAEAALHFSRAINEELKAAEQAEPDVSDDSEQPSPSKVKAKK